MLSLDLRSRTTPITVVRTKYFLRYIQDIIIFQKQLILLLKAYIARKRKQTN